MQLLSYVAADCDKKPRCKAISCKKVSRNSCKQDSTFNPKSRSLVILLFEAVY